MTQLRAINKGSNNIISIERERERLTAKSAELGGGVMILEGGAEIEIIPAIGGGSSAGFVFVVDVSH